MRPGIVIQHTGLPDRSSELVRCDIAGVVGFIPRARWPEGASAGDFLELVLRRERDLWEHPDRDLFDPAARQAVVGFFANGGDVAHIFGVCVGNEDELRTPVGAELIFASLLDRLRAEEDIALLMVPAAAYMRCELDRKGGVRADAEAIYGLLLAHCREMNNRFLVLDAPRGLHGAPLLRWVAGFRQRHAAHASYGALYYPWVFDGDTLAPPSGVIAGSYARLELERRPFGVGWPPANHALRGVTHPEVELDWEEAGALAEAAVNPIVIQPGRGVAAFGARTLSADPNMRYVNSRRVLNLVTEQLRRDNEWAVFETNNPHLWDVLERDVAFRLDEFAGGGLLVAGPEGGEYDVRCDRETNLPALRDAGQVNVRVTLRPVGTVEHVVVDLRIGDDALAGGA
ncbi:MAG: phage tail sheath family protein [Deltaproteobacteria bacterium]|jgi:hypothetical protein|nr:phage tail sheath family protein [Deltaproteobacteria bacterium]